MPHFYLNDTEVRETTLPPDLTILDYLRERQRKCGTKEGCASGDCGACTVVVARLDDNGALSYQALNSCISFAGSLHATQLITVEDLQEGSQLHPAQQAMVECHGSQCGFCTPGFVMSLFALWKNAAQLKDQSRHAAIERYLGGNLCRCTGYRPIVAAAEDMLAQTGLTDQFEQHEAQTIKQLAAIAPESDDNGYYRPATIDQMCELRRRLPQARIVAGATDLALEVTQKLVRFDALIDAGSVRELNHCQIEDGQIIIGAGLSLSDFTDAIEPCFADVAALMLRFGSQQVRNRGTVGGNIANASPIGDLPPVLIALNATLVLQSRRGVRDLPVEAFFLDYRNTALAEDEIVRAVKVPLRGGFARAPQLKVYKISKRIDDDISAVCAVFSVLMKGNQIEDISAAFGGMAAVPRRAALLENALRGQTLNATVIEKGVEAVGLDYQPISDVRASAHYRRRVAGNLLYRLADELIESTSA